MRRHNSTASAIGWQAGDAYGPNRLIEQIDEDDSDDYAVVHADNKTSPVRFFVAAVIMAAMILATMWYGVYDWTGWQRGVIITIGAINMMLIFPLILLIGNGDAPATLDIFRKWRTKSERMMLRSAAYDKWIDLESNKAQWEHEERMAYIAIENVAIADLGARMRALEDRASAGPQPQDGPASPGFVPKEADRARQLAAQYVLAIPGGLYRNGKPNPAKVAADGRLKSVPWSKRGAWKGADSVDAYRVLIEPAPGAPPLIREEITDGKVTGYYLNVDAYPVRGEAVRVLGLV